MADRLTNKVCVITGAKGSAAAPAQGASVFTVSIEEDECAAVGAALDEAGHDHGWAVANLTDVSATVAAFDACIDRFGCLDALYPH